MATKKPTGREPVESSWAGHARWSCPFCPFDSLEASRVREHLDLVHPISAPPPVKAAAPTTSEPVTTVTETDKEPADG